MPLCKKYAIHAVFLSLLIGIIWQGNQAAVTDRNSLLYNIIAGEEVVEGPLDPSAYASSSNNTPGIGGARLAALEPNIGMEMITEYDPEVNFSNTLGGNVLVAPLNPLAPEPGSEAVRPSVRRQIQIYTVQNGDTVAGIAAQLDVSANTVLWANGLSKNDVIKVGDHLTILPTTGVLHTIADGDTISAIARKYDVEEKEITDYNNLANSHQLSIGVKLIIPDGYIAPQKTPVYIEDEADNTQLADDQPDSLPVADGDGHFIWPTTTRHISQYFRWGHTGIDIDNRSLPAVYAAEAGTVQFSGRLGGYGNLVIVNHGSGLVTYYAHNTANYVSKGDSVAKGEAIAKVGSTGRSTGPHLHFEVRKNGRPVNPLSMY